jgi:hypothetical protein
VRRLRKAGAVDLREELHGRWPQDASWGTLRITAPPVIHRDLVITGVAAGVSGPRRSYRLPANAHATPMTFTGRAGRQYVVIAAGGGGISRELSRPLSDTVLAFALPPAGQHRRGMSGRGHSPSRKRTPRPSKTAGIASGGRISAFR